MAGSNGRATIERLTLEVGVAGNTGYWGGSGSGEHVAKLRGAPGRVIYDRMRRSDHQVRAVLSAMTLPIRQADFHVEPPSDGQEDVEIAERLQRALLEEMTLTWDDTVRHALLMLPFGFSALERVYEYRNGLVLPRKLDPRLPQSVVDWKYDAAGKRLTHMVQMGSDGKPIPIPIEKLLIFSTDREGDNWEGISILRYAYKAWYVKDDLERTNAIMHARWGAGIPMAEVPKGIERGSDEWNAGRQALEDIHAHEKAYVMQPEGWKFGILGGRGEGAGTEVLKSIQYYDEAIAKAMLAMHINLGSSQTGSRALGQSFIDAFLLSTQAWADYIAEVIDRFCVRELVDLNWGPRERYPHLRVKRIHGLDLQAIGFLMQAGVLTHDVGLEDSLRDVLRLPHSDASALSAPEPAGSSSPRPMRAPWEDPE